MNNLLTPQEVADQLKVSRGLVLDLVRDGKLRAVRLGRKTVRVLQEEVDRLVSDWRTKGYYVPKQEEEETNNE